MDYRREGQNNRRARGPHIMGGHPGHAKPKERRKSSSKNDEAIKLNSDVCKRMDPYFLRIIRVASQVALYEFDCQEQKWENTKVSGCLFLYERSQTPTNGLFILNRHSLNNYVQLLTSDIEVQVVSPHILVRNHEEIRCLWFYNESECLQIAKDVIDLLSVTNLNTVTNPPKAQNVMNTLTNPKASSEPATNLLDMLFHSNPSTKSASKPENENSQLEEQPGDRLVVKKKTKREVLRTEELHTLLFSKGDNGDTSSNASADDKPRFPNMVAPKLDVPVFDFRKEEEQEQVRKIRNKNSEKRKTISLLPNKIDSLGDELRAALGIQNKSDLVGDWVEASLEQDEDTLHDLSVKLDNVLTTEENQWNIQDPQPVSSGDFDSCWDSDEHFNGPAFTQKKKVSGATPGVYKKESFPDLPGHSNPFCLLEDTPVFESKPLGLNKEQLAQAFMYLLKNDGDFVDKLHRAYVCSIQSQL